MILELELLQTDVKTPAGYVYSRASIEEAITRFNAGGKLLYGYNLNSDVPDPLKVSHQVIDMRLDGTTVLAKLKVLETPHGKIVQEILADGGQFQLQPSMLVQFDQSNTPTPTIKDIKFISVDLVLKE